jgi:hypothetical protein
MEDCIGCLIRVQCGKAHSFYITYVLFLNFRFNLNFENMKKGKNSGIGDEVLSI